MIGLAARPSEITWASSVAVRATPPPWPPSVNAGRTIAGSSIDPSARPRSASLTAVTMADHGTRRPADSIVSRKASRSSARWIAS